MTKDNRTGMRSDTFIQAFLQVFKRESREQILWFLISSLIPGAVVYMLAKQRENISSQDSLVISLIVGVLVGVVTLIARAAYRISTNNLLRLQGEDVIRDAYNSARVNISTSSLPRWGDWFLPAFQEHLSIQVGSMIGKDVILLPKYVRIFIMAERKSECKKSLRQNINDERRAEALNKIHKNYKISVGILTYDDLYSILNSLQDDELGGLEISRWDLGSPKRLKKILGKIDFSSIIDGERRIFKANRENKTDPRWEFVEIMQEENPVKFAAYLQLCERMEKEILDSNGELKSNFSLEHFLHEYTV